MCLSNKKNYSNGVSIDLETEVRIYKYIHQLCSGKGLLQMMRMELA